MYVYIYIYYAFSLNFHFSGWWIDDIDVISPLVDWLMSSQDCRGNPQQSHLFRGKPMISCRFSLSQTNSLINRVVKPIEYQQVYDEYRQRVGISSNKNDMALWYTSSVFSFFQRTQDIIACFVDPENGMVEANMDDFRVHLRNMRIKINNRWDLMVLYSEKWNGLNTFIQEKTWTKDGEEHANMKVNSTTSGLWAKSKQASRVKTSTMMYHSNIVVVCTLYIYTHKHE